MRARTFSCVFPLMPCSCRARPAICACREEGSRMAGGDARVVLQFLCLRVPEGFNEQIQIHDDF